ncbi:tetratricopeptide repeat protein [Celerinatantimonas yamalensis]|uniref:Sel1 repeat family protein n=1 Tax=Celerinatantimonas yamalensis TaxID=559956 RepID=A0ABW9GD00_9GAMM
MKRILIGVLSLIAALAITVAESYCLYHLPQLHQIGLIGQVIPIISLLVMIYLIHDRLQLSKGPRLTHKPAGFAVDNQLFQAWDNAPHTDPSAPQHYQTDAPWRRYLQGHLQLSVRFPILFAGRRCRSWLKKRAAITPIPYACWAARCWLHQSNQAADFTRAMAQLSRSVTTNDPTCYALLGYIYACPDSPYYDPLQALSYFKRGAKCHDPFAILNLAYCYEYGLGVSTNLEQAKALYQQTGEQCGYPVASYRLSLLLAQNPERLESAYYWAYIAMIESDHASASVTRCEQLVQQLFPEQIVELEARAKPLLRLLSLKRAQSKGVLLWQATSIINMS